MKGIIKFCMGDTVMNQRFYQDAAHRELIIQGYKGQYDSTVIAPKLEGESIVDLVPIELPEPKRLESVVIWDTEYKKAKRIKIEVA